MPRSVSYVVVDLSAAGMLSDTDGWHFLGYNVQQVSGGQMGNAIFLDGDRGRLEILVQTVRVSRRRDQKEDRTRSGLPRLHRAVSFRP